MLLFSEEKGTGEENGRGDVNTCEDSSVQGSMMISMIAHGSMEVTAYDDEDRRTTTTTTTFARNRSDTTATTNNSKKNDDNNDDDNNGKTLMMMMMINY